MMERSNDDWLSLLSGSGPGTDSAVADLREAIRRGLQKALRGHPGADDALLEDVTQESVMKVLSGLSSFRGDSKFTTWVVAVAVRVAFSELRRARWRDVSLDGLMDGGLAPDPVTTSSPSARTEKDELIARMRQVIDTELSQRQRMLLVAELNGVPQVELCDRLGLSRNALYKLGHDAQKLKRGLLASGVTEDDVREVFAITAC